jgi:hypothetical protein
MDDLRNEFGVMVMPRGLEVTASGIARIQNLSGKTAAGSIRVLIKPAIPA